jgi:hypothetical protein
VTTVSEWLERKYDKLARLKGKLDFHLQPLPASSQQTRQQLSPPDAAALVASAALLVSAAMGINDAGMKGGSGIALTAEEILAHSALDEQLQLMQGTMRAMKDKLENLRKSLQADIGVVVEKTPEEKRQEELRRNREKKREERRKKRAEEAEKKNTAAAAAGKASAEESAGALVDREREEAISDLRKEVLEDEEDDDIPFAFSFRLFAQLRLVCFRSICLCCSRLSHLPGSCTIKTLWMRC